MRIPVSLPIRALLRRPPRIRTECRVAFVISAPRSGSTWLQTALNNHPEICCVENRLFGEFCEIWPDGSGEASARITLDKYVSLLSTYYYTESVGMSAAEFREALLPALINTVLTFTVTRSGKNIVIDKVTPYLETSRSVVASIEKYFPEAKIIQLVRDGRDVLTSGVFDWLSRSSPESPRYQYFLGGRRDVALSRFFTDRDIHTWSRYWCQPIQALSGNNRSVLVLRYEDMKTDQSACLRRIAEYCGASVAEPLIAKCVEESSFVKMSGGRRIGQEKPGAKTRKGVVGDWRNYMTQADGRLFDRLAGRYLVSMGYEKDGSWVGQLPVALDL